MIKHLLPAPQHDIDAEDTALMGEPAVSAVLIRNASDGLNADAFAFSLGRLKHAVLFHDFPVKGIFQKVGQHQTEVDLRNRKLAGQVKLDSGQAALALLQSEKIELVLLDVEMPGMSGTETLTAIRARQELAQVPVLFLSASEDMESAVANGEYAVQGFIKKPMLPQRLYERVEEVLG